MTDLLDANWSYPTTMRVGPGRVQELSTLCKSIAIKSPLLVTDPGLSKLDMTKQIIADVISGGLAIQIFSNIKPNPTNDNIEDGILAYHQGQHDGVIAFGGGSAMDAAKAIALMCHQTGTLWDYQDVGDNWLSVNAKVIAPVIAIPTTAGTGSEVGRASVITDPIARVKKVIFHPNMLPKLVILDPELTTGLPANITAATGMDALSHNLEAYCALGYHPMADGIAMEGMALIKQYLPRVYQNGHDVHARTQMLVASSMGATAFQKGLGAMHALSHPLGAIYDVHHGRLNAILMPYILQANRPIIEASIDSLAHYLDIDHGFEGFLTWILRLRESLHIEHTLAEVGIGTSQVIQIATMATEDAASLTNPIRFTIAQYQTILTAAIKGDLESL